LLKTVTKFLTSHRFSQFTLILGDFVGVVVGYRLAFAIYFQLGVWYVSTTPGT
jgi:hypothetical protein